MGLLSIFKRKSDAADAAPDTREAIDDVAQARTRARRRLIGAVVLVVIGIIGFPLVFETQPRPIPLDIPIEIPRKEGAPDLVMPRPSADAALPRSAAPVEPAASEEVITESRAEVEPGRELPPASPTAPSAKAPEPAAAKPSVARPAEDAARAQALLEGKASAKSDAASSSSSRFIVQVGAFAEMAAARDARQKAEKLGLKTYTQVTETPNGNRIRVRVGPFASRDDADKALAKARAAGLSGVILTL